MRLMRGQILRGILKQEVQSPLSPQEQLAWLIAFNDGLFKDMNQKGINDALKKLAQGVQTSSLTLDDPRENWAARVAEWLL